MKSEDPRLSQVLDLPLLLEHLGDDTELLRELTTLFIVEYPKQLQDLQNSVAAGDLNGIQRAAHKIKGTARNFLAERAAASALALEKAKEFDRAAISEMTSQLARELQLVQSALEEVLADRGR